MSRDDAAVVDMLVAARRAVAFAAGQTRSSFAADLKTQSSVLHQVTVLGEAARRVSEAYRSEHPSVPWRPIAGLRDRVIHQYDQVDLDMVWAIIEVELPRLIAALEALVPQDRS